MLRTETISDLCKKYPNIKRSIVEDIFLSGYDKRSAKFNSDIITLFNNLGPEDSIKYKDAITSLYTDSLEVE